MDWNNNASSLSLYLSGKIFMYCGNYSNLARCHMNFPLFMEELIFVSDDIVSIVGYVQKIPIKRNNQDNLKIISFISTGSGTSLIKDWILLSFNHYVHFKLYLNPFTSKLLTPRAWSLKLRFLGTFTLLQITKKLQGLFCSNVHPFFIT